MAIISGAKAFSESDWESKEFDWTGKTFYFISFWNIFGNPVGLYSKLEQLNREYRQNGYRAVNNMILIQYSNFKGRMMIEVEKQDKYDAQAFTYDETTTADTVVHTSSKGSLGDAVKRIKSRVGSRRGMEPREVYYWLVSGPGSDKIVVVALT